MMFSAKALMKVIRILIISFSLTIGFALLLSPIEARSAESSGRNILFILDASGSMWGKIDDRAKIVIAKEVMIELIKGLPEGVNIGLQVYGHRREGDCNDIEVLVPVGKGDKDTLIKQIQSINPKGKTPISKSLEMAGEQLEALEEEVAVILVSDGEETCEGDPCEMVKELKEKGIKVTIHVVGFDVTDEEGQQLSCIAEAGGGRYFTAKNAEQLKEALVEVKEEVVSKKPPPNTEFWTICKIDADGTSKVRIVEGGIHPAWSPDGKRIAFIRPGQLFVINADGTNEKSIFHGMGSIILDPAWSPDGKRIAFFHMDNGIIYLINPDGTNRVPLIDGAHPAWSPDGKRIVFSRSDGIYVMNADGTNIIHLADEQGYDPAWSPDEKRIVFSRSDGIYVMNADGTNIIHLADEEGYDPAWSPDGKRIAYALYTPEGYYHIYVMNADGTDKLHLVNYGNEPAWSPDGSSIIYNGFCE